MLSMIFNIARLFAFRGLSDSFLSLSRWIAVAGIVIGLSVLIIAMSAINGVQKFLETQLLQAFPHVIVQSQAPQDTLWQPLVQRLRNHTAVRDLHLLINAPALALTNETMVGVSVAGFDSEEAKKPPPYKIIAGIWIDLWRINPSVVVGRPLAEKLQLRVGSHLPLLRAKNPANGQGFVVQNFEVVAIYETGTELDQAMVVVSDAALRDFLKWPANYFNALNIKLHDPIQAAPVSHELLKELPMEMMVTDWIRYSQRFFMHIQSSKRMVFLSLVLILIVACFSVVSMLVVMTHQKSQEIAILRSLGATRYTIAGVFMAMGGMLALPGVAVGTLTGLAVSTNLDKIFRMAEQLIGTRLMVSDVYPVQMLVGDVRYDDIFVMNLMTILLCVLMSAYPAWLASKVDPAVVFRQG
jgi:lipoprotein-releasing system permease protein